MDALHMSEEDFSVEPGAQWGEDPKRLAVCLAPLKYIEIPQEKTAHLQKFKEINPPPMDTFIYTPQKYKHNIKAKASKYEESHS